jgi:sporulation protein YlmC with PRC-barrel domain
LAGNNPAHRLTAVALLPQKIISNMRLSFSHLKSLPVETKSGQYLGKVGDCLIDPSSHAVTQYEVRNGRVRQERLLVSRDQVLEISSQKIIVDDAVITELVRDKALKKLANKASPALTSNQ